MNSQRIRKFLAPLVAVLLAAAAAASLVVLDRRANGYRIAQATLANTSAQFALVSVVPIELSRRGVALQAADTTVDRTEAAVTAKIAALRRNWPVPQLGAVATQVRASFAAIDQLDHLVNAGDPAGGAGPAQGVAPVPGSGGGPQGAARAPGAGAPAAGAGTPLTTAVANRAHIASEAAKRTMQQVNQEYDRLASRAQTDALIATLLAIAMLLAAFLVFYFRWIGILRRTERDARSDALTGLGNRRALLERLELALPEASREQPLALTLYDLDGFKAYNDSFGHLAGDALLARFAQRLREALGDSGTAYRMGGDEFCSLSRVSPDGFVQHVASARAVLTESGEGFEISCSAGSVLLPEEASSVHDALALADLRMYEHKGTSGRRLDPSQRSARA